MKLYSTYGKGNGNDAGKTASFFRPRKIRLSFNPYTFVRTAVMKTKLLKAEDYSMMLKLSTEEMISFLQSKGYTEFSGLRMSYNGIELVEEAVKQNLMASFEKLRRISDERLVQVIDAYLFRHDINSLKVVLRLWKSGQQHDKSHERLFFGSSYGTGFYSSLLSEGQEKAVKRLKGTKFSFIIDMLDKSLFFIETELDKTYYTMLFELASKLNGQSRLMESFIEEELMSKSIIALLKLSMIGDNELSAESTEGLVFDPRAKPRKSSPALRLISMLKDAKTLDERIKLVEARYKDMKGALEKARKGEFSSLESEMQKHMLRKIKRLSFVNILSVDTILAYMFLKDLEAKNIVVLYKLKSFGFSSDEIMERIVI